MNSFQNEYNEIDELIEIEISNRLKDYKNSFIEE